MFFESLAYAMGTPQGGAGTPTEMFVQVVPLILMVGVFWFMLIRPQKKRQQEHKNMLESLRRGETVVTSGGIIGRIVDIDDEIDILTLDLGETRVRIGRGFITGIFDAKTQQALKDGKKGKSEAKKKAAPQAKAELKEGASSKGAGKIEADAAEPESKEEK